jgi:hypothetical protein
MLILLSLMHKKRFVRILASFFTLQIELALDSANDYTDTRVWDFLLVMIMTS